MIKIFKGLSIWLWGLSLAILLTIYLAWLIYPFEISFLKLESVVYLEKDTIGYNFNQLMSYLTNPFHQYLIMANFKSSANGLKHFKDVKHLFHLTQVVFLILTIMNTSWLLKLKKQFLFDISLKEMWYAILLPIVIGIIALGVGFDQFFTIFHQFLFPGDSTWLFDPLKDPVIWILPERFFSHCFMLFFLFYEIIFGFLAYLKKKNVKF